MTAMAGSPGTVDVVVVGAGFGGMLTTKRCLDAGLDVVVLETGDDVGGTWYWNRYPGARCDIRSAEYSYSVDPDLEQEWTWTERFAAQPEILSYARHVAERWGLYEHIRFGSTVVEAAWDDDARRWSLVDAAGTVWGARYCVWATGPLSVPKTPDVVGIDDFAGEVYTTGAWPHDDPDLSGVRCGVIGTGSSGIQTITALADVVGELHVFQRTPSFTLPARNATVDEQIDREVKRTYAEIRERARSMPNGQATYRSDVPLMSLPPSERDRRLQEQWDRGGIGLQATFADVMTDRHANDYVAAFVKDRVRELVDDERTADLLLALDEPIGARRVCIDTGYYDVYNRPHVRLVDLRSAPIEQVEAKGIRTAEGLTELDVIVLATGFDAMTGALARIDLRGRGGRRLSDDWSDGPRTYLGLMVAEFPNMFLVAGPGSPSVAMNVILAIEHNVETIFDLMGRAERLDASVISVEESAQEEWTRHVAEVAEGTLFVEGSSWYSGANVEGKPRVLMPYFGGFPRYVSAVDAARRDAYPGVTFS